MWDTYKLRFYQTVSRGLRTDRRKRYMRRERTSPRVYISPAPFPPFCKRGAATPPARSSGRAAARGKARSGAKRRGGARVKKPAGIKLKNGVLLTAHTLEPGSQGRGGRLTVIIYFRRLAECFAAVTLTSRGGERHAVDLYTPERF